FILCSSHVSAQRSITGTVSDAGTDEPLPGVTIVVTGTTSGTITDFNGHYSLSVPEGQDELTFSFIGYSAQTVPIGSSTVIDIELAESTKAIDEVVVTG